MSKYFYKNNYATIALRGEDKEAFLQNIVTANVKLVDDNHSIYSLLLNNRGRYISDFTICAYKNLLLLNLNPYSKDMLLSMLNNYKLHYKLEIFDVTEMIATYWIWGDLGINLGNNNSIDYLDGKLILDPRHRLLPARIILDNNSAGKLLVDAGFTYKEYDYEKLRFKLAIPEAGKDLIIDKSLPYEFCLDKLNAISYNKGCYIGQELVARSKHVGTVRKHIMQLIASKPINSLSEIYTYSNSEPEKTVNLGKITSYHSNVGIAIIRQEEYQNAINNQQSIFIEEDIQVQILKPSWL